jgi:hypothetical protein
MECTKLAVRQLKKENAKLNKLGEELAAKLRQVEGAFEIRGDHLKAAEEKIAELQLALQQALEDGEITECYCADNVAVKQTCPYCVGKETL